MNRHVMNIPDDFDLHMLQAAHENRLFRRALFPVQPDAVVIAGQMDDFLFFVFRDDSGQTQSRMRARLMQKCQAVQPDRSIRPDDLQIVIGHDAICCLHVISLPFSGRRLTSILSVLVNGDDA
ncbi:hypothetical protein NST23_21185 [Brevibacillus sp. FSL K6-0770]|uniref:hypothetical protein n=1 Tax=Brevibacillus sp. FSL K6-0770 TaxID=2954673 RepID=UPI0030F8763A